MIEILKLLAIPASGLITYIMGHWIGRRKTKTEIDKLEIDALGAVVLFYKNTFLDLKAELEALGVRCKDLTVEIEILRSENKDLKKTLLNLNFQLKKYENAKTK